MARILLIEDDDDQAQMLQMVLQSGQHEVTRAASREEGEALARAQEHDLLFVDVMMPRGAEGFQLVWNLRADPSERLREVPIVMLTAVNEHVPYRFDPQEDDGTYEPGEFLPVQGWLDKPVKAEDLLAMVEKLTS